MDEDESPRNVVRLAGVDGTFGAFVAVSNPDLTAEATLASV